MTDLEQVYRDNRASLLRSLSIRCRAEAEEVLHEAVVRLLSRDKLDHNALPALIYRTAVNLFLDRRNQHCMHIRLNPIAAAGPDEFSPTPEDCIVEHQRAELFDLSLDQLQKYEPRLAQAFLLRTEHELQWAEIGRRMSVSTRMAEIYVARAVRYCHEFIERGAQQRVADGG